MKYEPKNILHVMLLMLKSVLVHTNPQSFLFKLNLVDF